MTLENAPEHGDARVNRIHIERGAVAMGTDGPLGTVEQIVIDENTGELRALILRGGRSGRNTEEVEISASHVVPGSVVGHQVDLDIGMADIRAHPELIRPYDPDRYFPVHEEMVLPPSEAGRAAVFTERPVVTEIGENAAEVVVPEPGGESQETAETIAGERPAASTMQTVTSADEGPTLVLRMPRSLAEREREAAEIAEGREPETPVDVEPPIAPDRVADTAADQAVDEAPGLGTSEPVSGANARDDPERAAEAPSPASATRPGDLLHTPEPPITDAVPDQDEVEDAGPPVPFPPTAGDGPSVPTQADVGITVADTGVMKEQPMESMANMANSAQPSVPMGRQIPGRAASDWEMSRRGGNPGVLIGLALGVVAAVVAVWLTRRAAKRTAARVRKTTRTAGKTTRTLTRTAQDQVIAARERLTAMPSGAKQMARSLADTTRDLPGRYRWFRRGVWVGSRLSAPLAGMPSGKLPLDVARRQPAWAYRWPGFPTQGDAVVTESDAGTRRRRFLPR
jgi:hypothetical protein